MNNKLKEKLAIKAAAIKEGKLTGSDAYKLVGGSHGVTINPHPKRTFEHNEFRRSFNASRDIAKGINRGRNSTPFRRTKGAFGKQEVLDAQRTKILTEQQEKRNKTTDEDAHRIDMEELYGE